MSLRCDWLDGWWGSKKSQAAQKRMSITKTQQKRSSILFYISLNLIQTDSDLFVLSEYFPFFFIFFSLAALCAWSTITRHQQRT